jgi:hypothetical protein
VHTEIVDLQLTGVGDAAVRAGTVYALPMSPGEVESLSTNGDPAQDFPAESFFNVYFEADVPPCGSLFPGATVYNTSPVLVQAELSGFPPTVVYIHGETGAAPVYFRNDNLPLWQAGDRLGWLVLAGHGADMTLDDVEEYCAELESAPVMPAPIPTVTEWGLAGMGAAVLTGGAVLIRRRRARAR